MAASFAHLHTHTEYSLLDGAARIAEVVASAVADGQPAVGITDHGNMYGVLDFYKACRDQDVNPVIGSELYMAEESRHTRPGRRNSRHDEQEGGSDGEGERIYYHLTALAETTQGYRNLIQLSSRAFLEGFHHKPRGDWELLDQYSNGLIVTTGCLSGHVLSRLKVGDFDGAVKYAGRLQDIVGKDNMFVEVQDHGIADQVRTLPMLLELARTIGAPLLATNDSHYVHRHDAKAHDALLCVQTGSLLADTNRFRFDAEEHYLKTAAEMRHVFRDLPEACDNTLWVAERANVEITFGEALLPEFPLPDNYTSPGQYLRDLTYDGARKRWGPSVPAHITERLDYELAVIDQMGFSAYFLIVWDLIRHARDNNIRVGPGRGSAAGCAVAYALRITDLDPIRYDLLFERFLNPERVSMPDIDMDFDSRYRDEMIRYAAERYGRDHVAQIVTFSTIKARAAVRDAARVLGKPYLIGDKIAKAMPPLIAGRDTPLWAAIAEKPPEKFENGWKAATDLRAMIKSDPDAAEVVEVARGLEGMRRSDGIHAAAVVITKEPLTEYLPVQRKPEPGKPIEAAPIITQYEMHGVEALGLLKMDFLGLRNLDVIDTTVRLVQQSRGITVPIDDLPLDDPATFDLLGRGDTIGVFQLESSQMRDLLRRMKPTTFEDIGAVVALYRPGPMGANMHIDYADRKNGRQQVETLHPDLSDVLDGTYGLMIYQESMMRVAQRLAGYNLAQADSLRKACGKKDRNIMAEERAKFVHGCETNGYGTEVGNKVFDVIEPFADYAFNKSHAFGYGLITYQTSYLKANYPAEYLAALLTRVKERQEKAAVILAEARRMGLTVLNPDVNTSGADFSVVPDPDDPRGAVLFGLSGIRHVGTGMVERIVDARNDGPFTDFYDFCERVDLTVLNKRTIECLVKAGAFDSFGHPRGGLVQSVEPIVDHAAARRRDNDQGIMNLFDTTETGGFDDRPPISGTVWPKKTELAFEKEMLGQYVSEHPLADFAGLLARVTSHHTADLVDLEDGAPVTIAGQVTAVARKHTKKGDLMATFTLVDLTGETEVTVFPRTYTKISDLLTEDRVVVIDGRIDRGGPGRDDTDTNVKVAAMSVAEFDGGDPDQPPIQIRLRCDLTDSHVDAFKQVLRRHQGQTPVIVEFTGQPPVRLPMQWAINPSEQFQADLAVTFGPDTTTTITEPQVSGLGG